MAVERFFLVRDCETKLAAFEKLQGVLRRRDCFRERSSGSAQDDTLVRARVRRGGAGIFVDHATLHDEIHMFQSTHVS